MRLISTHGGQLVNREVCGLENARLTEASAGMPALELSPREISDLEMIATGAYSPLDGFLCAADYRSVCSNMRLANGVAWPIPVTLSVTAEKADLLREGEDVALYQDAHLVGVLHVAEKYR